MSSFTQSLQTVKRDIQQENRMRAAKYIKPERSLLSLHAGIDNGCVLPSTCKIVSAQIFRRDKGITHAEIKVYLPDTEVITRKLTLDESVEYMTIPINESINKGAYIELVTAGVNINLVVEL